MNIFGSATAFNPGRNSTLVIEGIQISGDCLWKRAVPFPIGTKLFVDASGNILEDPQIFNNAPPEVQFLGTVIKDGYILVTPKRLPVIL